MLLRIVKGILCSLLLGACLQAKEINVYEMLTRVGWQERVGAKVAFWVSIPRQRLFVVQQEQILCQYSCSTAQAGCGNKANSYCTPLGWHAIGERIGENHPWGAIFKERRFTKNVWDPSSQGPPAKDLILSRILWLEGLEPGVNKGGDIDTHDRYIYIHGTHAEDAIGTPVSRGCIRMRNDDVMQLFDQTYSGMPVYISNF